MKGKIKGTICSMVTLDSHNFVDIKLDTISGTLEVEGDNPRPAPDAKEFTGEISIRVKPVMAKKFHFGQQLYFTVSDEEK